MAQTRTFSLTLALRSFVLSCIHHTRACTHYSCGQRILFSMDVYPENEACQRVAEQYPDECGLCHPTNCTAPPTLQPTPAPSISVSPTFPPFDVTTPGATCGCFACTDEILNRSALGFTCRERINYLQTPAGGSKTEFEACFQTAEDYSVCSPAWYETHTHSQNERMKLCRRGRRVAQI